MARNLKKIPIRAILLLAIFSFVFNACASNKKYKSQKPVPCPCEKNK